jgi:hypothetical protein
MITIKIEVPHQITQVMTPKMVMGNYIESDPRVKKVREDKANGLCEVEVKSEMDFKRELSWILINAKYYSREEEVLAQLSM